MAKALITPRYFRPTEVDFLQGDSSKAKKKLGWNPKVGFNDRLRMMVDSDLQALIELKNPIIAGR